MAVSYYDAVSIGLYSGSTAELTNTDKQDVVYAISLGLISTTATITPGLVKSVIKIIGASFRKLIG